MATIHSGQQDKAVRSVKSALDAYEHAHPGADATLYRQNSASIRIRIVDKAFAGLSRGDRHDSVWEFLSEKLDDDTIQEISVLLLLAPGEQQKSFMNFEFEHPVPSGF